MKFITYLDNRFQEISLRQQEATSYSLSDDAEAGSLRWTMFLTIWFLKVLFIPKGILGFLLMKLGVFNEPLPAVLLQAAKQEENTKIAKDVIHKLKTAKDKK